MKTEDFNTLLEYRLAESKAVLASKAKEYATDDRLHNFKVAASVNNTTPAKALWGMASKHLVSVMDIINSKQPYSDDHIDEKLGDLINYLILLEAVLKDSE